MCLLLFSYKTHPKYSLILAANRDEFYARPTTKADWWQDEPYLLAGKDLQAGGTWMGITRSGRFAALTNYRAPSERKEDAPTRGKLVSNFLTGTDTSKDYLEGLRTTAENYNGYNLLVDDGEGLVYFGSMTKEIIPLTAGTYGLSNHLLDTPWPKVERGKSELTNATHGAGPVNTEVLMSILRNPEQAPDDKLPDTGVGLKLERMLSPLFIQSPKYGTRVSTIMLMDYDGHVYFEEYSHQDSKGVKYDFSLERLSSSLP